jgi:hypothetical protein
MACSIMRQAEKIFSNVGDFGDEQSIPNIPQSIRAADTLYSDTCLDKLLAKLIRFITGADISVDGGIGSNA